VSVVSPAVAGTHVQPHADYRAVSEAIDALFSRKHAAAEAYGPEFALLWRTASETVRGGKLVRPRLLVAAYCALSGERHAPPAIVEAAAAVELLHYAFLLHDDVIDSDSMRRGRPNLLGVMTHSAQELPRAAHWGTTSAILMGDLALSASYQSFARLDVERGELMRILDVVDHTIDETVAGELVDVALGDGVAEPTLAVILDMSANKTASYTFELPLRLAAILAGASSATETALALAGRQLGLAFQLDDDLLCAFGDPNEVGKDQLSDFREGKQTPLIASARTTPEWHLIEDLVGWHDLTEADAVRIREVLVSCGAKQRVEELRDAALAYVHEACDSDNRLVPEAIVAVLRDFTEQLEGRRS
jgi:geranylgeranyl diphosphate synthase type II